MKKDVIILAGPTGIGKTELSLLLAEELNGEIISADSMQIYKGMDIGTAKISKEETRGIKHHMLSFIDPKDEYSVKEYREDALNIIRDVISRGKFPIVVGGTGFYIESLLYKPNFSYTNKDDKIRERYEYLDKKYGGNFLHCELKKVDPIRAKKLHPNEKKKIIRALEVYELTGIKMSSMKEEKEVNDEFNFHLFVLNMDRNNLYKRINRRVELMVENGLVEENMDLYMKGLSRNNQATKAIGYREVFDYLLGLSSYDEMIRIIKKDTRRYAKRQLTWFRREKLTNWINKDEYENDEEIVEVIKSQIE